MIDLTKVGMFEKPIELEVWEIYRIAIKKIICVIHSNDDRGLIK